MNKTKLAKFKQFFLDKQQDIIRSSAARAADTVDAGGDDADIVSAQSIKKLSDELSRRELYTLRQIEAGLYRIEQETFGICEECEEDISDARLSAMPYSALCISCAEQQEHMIKTGNFD